MKKVLITGVTGLVGAYLKGYLSEKGYTVLGVSRRAKGEDTVSWDLGAAALEKDFLKGVDAVVHLAGMPVAKYLWSKGVKKDLWDSRVRSTELLVEAMRQHTPKVFVCASAIGYYADTQATCDEKSAKGSDFLSDLVSAWEQAAAGASDLGVRRLSLRLGHVLGRQGGLLPPLLWAQRYNLGAILGNGQQVMSWIHVHDIACVVEEALRNERYQGVINATAPSPVTLGDMTHEIANAMGKRLWLPKVPAWFLRLTLGEMSVLFLSGNAVLPKKLQALKFRFKYPSFDEALANLLDT